MAVQLSVFPQYSLVNANLTNPNFQYYVDGINWSSLNGSTTNVETAGVTFVQDQVDHYFGAGMILNTFYRGDTVAATVDMLSSACQLGPGDMCCLLQKINNISLGANYQIVFDIAVAAGASEFTIYEYNGNTLVQQFNMGTPAITTIAVNNVQFASSQPTIVLGFKDPAGTAQIIINSFRIQSAGSQPQGFFDTGEILLDLYEDEDIPLTLSVDDFTKVAEKVQSYSKSFKIPETKKNQRAFDNIFEITRLSDSIIFNPYLKTKCNLKVDGFLVFEGFLRLIDVNDKEGEVSYNVNLYSEAIALKDVLDKREIGDIDFEELAHLYDITQIKLSWNDSPAAGITYLNPSTSGYRDANDTLKYPFCDWTHALGVNSSNGYPELPRLEAAFRPWLNIKYLINRIFEDTGFTWSSTFFDSVDFEKLYMDFNWGSQGVPLSIQTVNSTYNFYYVGGTAVPPANGPVPTSATIMTAGFFNAGGNSNPPQLNGTNGLFTCDADNMQVISQGRYMLENTTGSTINFTVQIAANIGGVAQILNPVTFAIPANSTAFVTPYHTTTLPSMNIGDTFSIESFASAVGLSNVYNITFLNQDYFVTIINLVSANLINTERGELKQWDFLSGILKMFNLVTIPSTIPNEIIFETYADTFINQISGGAGSGDVSLAARGVTHNWTDKIDTGDIKLKPLTNLNAETIFKFAEDEDDYSFTEYKRATRHLYGSKVFDASGATLLTGEEEISAKPFAATVIKPLLSNLTELIVPAIYAYNQDSGGEEFDNLPRILYNVGKKTMLSSFYNYPAQNGGSAGLLEQDILQFSHTTEIPSTAASYDFVFGEQNLINGVGVSPVNNLFNLYWLPYFNELYNPDTRTMTLKVNLSAADINTFKFSDQVFIKQRVFRVNRIDYKPNDLSVVEFILIP